MRSAMNARPDHGQAAREVDLLVVGAGPSRLYAAYYAGLRGMSVALMDSLPEPGGQVTALYPEKMIYDVAGGDRGQRRRAGRGPQPEAVPRPLVRVTGEGLSPPARTFPRVGFVTMSRVQDRVPGARV